jgi:quercetin dioxygenase-like cupin family protein
MRSRSTGWAPTHGGCSTGPRSASTYRPAPPPAVDVAGFEVVRPEALTFATRPHEPGEPRRHVAQVTELAGLEHTRANFFRLEPGAKGKPHDEDVQEETYVPVRGTLTMYVGEPPARHEVPVGGVIHVRPGTQRQIANETGEELLVYIVGAPPG